MLIKHSVCSLFRAEAFVFAHDSCEVCARYAASPMNVSKVKDEDDLKSMNEVGPIVAGYVRDFSMNLKTVLCWRPSKQWGCIGLMPSH